LRAAEVAAATSQSASSLTATTTPLANAELMKSVGLFGRTGRGEIAAGSIPNFGASSVINTAQLRAYLTLIDAGILDKTGMLTEHVVLKARPAISANSIFKNQAVIDELTKNGSKIGEWTKVKSPSIELSTGQKIQVHFYKNKVTNRVNYNIDFKVSSEVHHPLSKHPNPKPQPTYSP
jgi:hypothetical protein